MTLRRTWTGSSRVQHAARSSAAGHRPVACRWHPCTNIPVLGPAVAPATSTTSTRKTPSTTTPLLIRSCTFPAKSRINQGANSTGPQPQATGRISRIFGCLLSLKLERNGRGAARMRQLRMLVVLGLHASMACGLRVGVGTAVRSPLHESLRASATNRACAASATAVCDPLLASPASRAGRRLVLARSARAAACRAHTREAVSYTHLTLPTILLV